MFSAIDQNWMRKAIELAKTAQKYDEVPVGAVLTLDDRLIAEGFNQPILHCDPTAHAEIIALRNAGDALKNYRLINTTLYVTLEPCLMCMGAIHQARIKRLVFGASDTRWGSHPKEMNHQVEIQGGLLASECAGLLIEFFKGKRAIAE